MWEQDYDYDPILPPLEERMAVLYAAVLKKYWKKVAPGYFEALAKR